MITPVYITGWLLGAAAICVCLLSARYKTGTGYAIPAWLVVASQTGATLTLLVSTPPVAEALQTLTGLPHVGRFLCSQFAIVACALAQATLTWWITPEERVRSRIGATAGLGLLVSVALTVLYASGPEACRFVGYSPAGFDPDHVSWAGNARVLAYSLIISAYLVLTGLMLVYNYSYLLSGIWRARPRAAAAFIAEICAGALMVTFAVLRVVALLRAYLAGTDAVALTGSAAFGLGASVLFTVSLSIPYVPVVPRHVFRARHG
ncbi:hypothetical protein [Streptomyces sp. BH105]|uniref:hypothetical protein n=1 Tax=Streptomyces sp. BH105 TaxID=3410408 RepID=UPI003CFA9FDF